MLILARRIGERITIAGHIEVEVVAIQGNRVRLAIVAPREVRVERQEIRAQTREPSAESRPQATELSKSSATFRLQLPAAAST